MKHSQSLREEVIGVAVTGSESQDRIAESFGVSRSTVQNWLRQYRASGARTVTEQEKRPQSWTNEERLDALLQTRDLSGEELGRWCREHGVHTHHLKRWREELIAGLGQKSESARDSRPLRQEIRELKKELRRKDKALAETSALLVLKKKAASIWGEVEDD